MHGKISERKKCDEDCYMQDMQEIFPEIRIGKGHTSQDDISVPETFGEKEHLPVR